MPAWVPVTRKVRTLSIWLAYSERLTGPAGRLRSFASNPADERRIWRTSARLSHLAELFRVNLERRRLDLAGDPRVGGVHDVQGPKLEVLLGVRGAQFLQ